MVFGPRAQAMLRQYPAEISEQRMGGVNVRIITPRVPKLDRNRLLINVHGGNFNTCAEACSLMESLPIAFRAGMKVVSIDYRMAPEHVFPAASEDVEAVYRQLIKSYKPTAIGMFGCSAGGMLSAQSAAWLPSRRLPQFGAVGIFGSGALRAEGGDSIHFARYADGLWRAPASAVPPGSSPQPALQPVRSYFFGASVDDPMVSPAVDATILGRFPPALIITGTRAADMSPAVVTHSRLLAAGVKSQLIVGEGMGHCYIYESQLPESQFAYEQIARFFRDTLRN